MGIEFNNDYGINRKEWKALKKELKTEAKQNENIDFKRSDIKELKSAIKTGDLGAHLDQVGKDMQGIMGLKLTGKVNGTEDINAIHQMIKDIEFNNDVDKAKVLKYIDIANIDRIADQQKVYGETIRGIEANNSRSMAENLFASPEFEKLNQTFGLQ